MPAPTPCASAPPPSVPPCPVSGAGRVGLYCDLPVYRRVPVLLALAHSLVAGASPHTRSSPPYSNACAAGMTCRRVSAAGPATPPFSRPRESSSGKMRPEYVRTSCSHCVTVTRHGDIGVGVGFRTPHAVCSPVPGIPLRSRCHPGKGGTNQMRIVRTQDRHWTPTHFCRPSGL